MAFLFYERFLETELTQSMERRVGRVVSRKPDFLASPGKPNRFVFRAEDCAIPPEKGDVVTFEPAAAIEEKGKYPMAVNIAIVPHEVAKIELESRATAAKKAGDRRSGR